MVRCTPQDQALGQVDIFVRSSGQADLWSDVPFRIRLWFRLTFGQIYPQDQALGQVMFGQSLGQADLWSDEPPQDQALGQIDN